MLKLCDISMYYQNGTNVTVGVQGINLEFKKGEFVVITGESGGGKTTLLNIISSLSPYHDGEMYFNGIPTSGYDDADWENYRREHIGFIFQNYNLIDSYTVLQNVVSTMLIKGIPIKEAKKKAMGYLEQVGISELSWRRASKLSSGQKQRLAIARALAKETDIIIADEPTGNLDSENGKQIVEILASLAREKLVIMVSHNIEEAEQYATRRIRMKDGSVVDDKQLCPDHTGSHKNTSSDSKLQSEKQSLKSELFLAGKLAAFNRKSQFVKAMILTIFMAVICTAAVIFLGSILSNMDDTPAKIYDNSAFLNGDDRRIVVKRNDGKPITEEDMNYFAGLDKVVFADMYDYANDCNYYWREGIDFDYNYSTFNVLKSDYTTETVKAKIPVFRHHSNFVRSISGITVDDLSAGRLPEHTNEIVIYSDDSMELNKTYTFYFADRKSWKAQYITVEMTVVGLLAEPTSQVYFHDNIAKAFIAGREETLKYTVNYRRYRESSSGEKLYDSYKSYAFIAFPDSTLPESTIVTTNNLNIDDPVGFSTENPPEGDLIAVVRYLVKKAELKLTEGGERLESDAVYDDCGTYYSVQYVPNYTTTINNICRIDEASFEQYIASRERNFTTQATIYITDYAYAQDVIKEINSTNEYEAISPFRIGSLEYDEEKVDERFLSLIISLVAIVAIFVLEIIILFNILRIKRDDYAVLKSLGLRTVVMNKMNHIELLTYCGFGMIVSAVVMAVLIIMRLPLIELLIKYYRWYHIVMLVFMNSIAAMLLSAWFNHYLDKQFSGKRISVESGK